MTIAANGTVDVPATDAVPKKKTRISYFDGARGYLLSMMFLAHYCYTLQNPLFKLHHGNYLPLMDAEFFVLISGFVCALAYVGAYDRGGVGGSMVAVLNRLKWVYAYQVIVSVMMILLFMGFGQTEVEPGYLADFETPLWRQVLDAALLKQMPPYLDILILYIGLMLFIPLAIWALEKAPHWVYWATLIGLYAFVRSGMDVTSDHALKTIFPYTDYFGISGYFQPFAYAIVFYGGFYLGWFVRRGRDITTQGPVPLNMTLFVGSLAIIAAFGAVSVLRLVMPVPEWMTYPDRQAITIVGLIATATVSYVVWYLIARGDGNKWTAPLGMLARRFFTLPFLTLLGRNSLFVYSMHIVAVFITCYALIVTGLSDSTVMRMVGVFGGYGLLLSIAWLKNKYLPNLP